MIAYSWIAAAVAEQRELMGENYWAYNIENNRKVLEAMTQYAQEQGLSPTRIDYMAFFHAEAASVGGGVTGRVRGSAEYNIPLWYQTGIIV